MKLSEQEARSVRSLEIALRIVIVISTSGLTVSCLIGSPCWAIFSSTFLLLAFISVMSIELAKIIEGVSYD